MEDYCSLIYDVFPSVIVGEICRGGVSCGELMDPINELGDYCCEYRDNLFHRRQSQSCGQEGYQEEPVPQENIFTYCSSDI